LDTSQPNHAFESLDKNNKLSEAMKSFSSIAKAHRVDFIKEKLGSTKPSRRITRIIPITLEEEEKQSSENSMSNRELILIIQSLI